ncbi:inositol monophosphatase [Candidatus Roizmanbacteria bacterium]|nr:inositol monophosphatase [Candidatus Roizmanbacteria bacterium]
MNYKSLCDEAIDISHKTADLLKAFKHRVTIHKMKGQKDFSTNADIAAENYICELIKKSHPTHNILSEEMGFLDKRGDYTWILDPLDGTQNFAAGTNDYALLIAIEHKHRLVVGITNFIGLRQTFWSYLGGGSYLDGRKITVSGTKLLRDSKIVLFSYKPKHGEREMVKHVKRHQRLIQTTHKTLVDDFDAKYLAYIALGYFEGHIRVGIGGGWWDVAPGILLVEEAGGKATDIDGKLLKNRNLSNGLIASNGFVHNDIIKLIQG